MSADTSSAHACPDISYAVVNRLDQQLNILEGCLANADPDTVKLLNNSAAFWFSQANSGIADDPGAR